VQRQSEPTLPLPSLHFCNVTPLPPMMIIPCSLPLSPSHPCHVQSSSVSSVCLEGEENKYWETKQTLAMQLFLIFLVDAFPSLTSQRPPPPLKHPRNLSITTTTTAAAAAATPAVSTFPGGERPRSSVLTDSMPVMFCRVSE